MIKMIKIKIFLMNKAEERKKVMIIFFFFFLPEGETNFNF